MASKLKLGPTPSLSTIYQNWNFKNAKLVRKSVSKQRQNSQQNINFLVWCRPAPPFLVVDQGFVLRQSPDMEDFPEMVRNLGDRKCTR